MCSSDLPAPLFTINFESNTDTPSAVTKSLLKRFFDRLEPAFGLQVSLGQMNTLVLCPALTSHSELTPEALAKAGITPSTIRISVGDEDPRLLISHFIQTAKIVFDPHIPNFSDGFLHPEAIDALYTSTYLSVHKRYVHSRPSYRENTI